MTDWQLQTPVAFLVFNRPSTTERVFNAIRQARPPRLLVVADGPRRSRPEERELCRRVQAITEQVDWHCELLVNVADENLGCMRRVSSGLDWVFSSVEEAIILEDDCLPHPTFFRYCEELLDRFRHDQRIAQICGVNFQFGAVRTPYSYYFSRYNHIWGWASWRRAWQLNDNAMLEWPEFRDRGGLKEVITNSGECRYWTRVLDRVHSGEIDTWDCRWTLSCWRHNLLSVIPAVNLVSNIGFGHDATHTSVRNRFANMPAEEMPFPLTHPEEMLQYLDADRYTGKTMFRDGSLRQRLLDRFGWLR